MPTSIFQHSQFLRHKASLYQGQIIQVCLASSLLSPNLSPQAVLARELSTLGYQRVVTQFDDDVGTYNSANGQLILPTIEATFTAATQTLSWSSAFVLVGDIMAAIINELPPINKPPGQSYTYRITLKELL